MRVSSAIVRQQSANIAALGASAGKAVKASLRRTGGDTDAIIDGMLTVTRAYSEMSAALAAEYYAAIRSASRMRSRFVPTPDNAYDAGKVTAATIAILNEVAAGKATVPLESLLSDVVSRYIRNSAEECIRGNARRDPAKPRYAIVPNGDACAFCQMRASLGYTYGDASAVDSHAHCTCVATPVFGDSTIQGYDPSSYREKYDEAAKAYRDKDISDDMMMRIKQAKESHDRRYAEGTTDRKWQEMNAILMIMREQQGIS